MKNKQTIYTFEPNGVLLFFPLSAHCRSLSIGIHENSVSSSNCLFETHPDGLLSGARPSAHHDTRVGSIYRQTNKQTNRQQKNDGY